ncbi:heavy-metal-associated domain-containing protein [Botrimarina hoheduenensis]|uniref:Heavy-metal-associated domain protein n=1 Tax=Botrimarina hoheduenensis TaxID=2528000 RepID=A0A5C5W7S9_9BACT|nr:heavy-metal-associated domain-containing protein [Botrimarina hoheduenensis]TWT46770.1 Heavy-metal-associated domain protein [Botrimarina hoheduenensis]
MPRSAPRFSAIGFLTLLLCGYLASAEEPRVLPTGRIEIAIEDLHCGTCAKRVARKLYGLKGVQKVSWDLSADLVVVYQPASQPVSVLPLWAAVTAGGVKPAAIRYEAIHLDAAAIGALQEQAAADADERR